jgi:hypothetical protein
MRRKQRIKELETELRILYSQMRIVSNKSDFHARHNKYFKRYAEKVKELESISIKWKIKKIIRRIKSLWQK